MRLAGVGVGGDGVVENEWGRAEQGQPGSVGAGYATQRPFKETAISLNHQAGLSCHSLISSLASHLRNPNAPF